MPASEARIAAARANGARSQGPVTPEGKDVSRRNALKHGMAGDGVVLPPGDAVEVDRRSAAMVEEMRPSSELGRFLVGRLARLTVRVERCAEQELVMNADRAAHAEAAFDEARIAEVDLVFSRIGDEPVTLTRKLRSMPEGVDRMVAGLLDLRDELDAGRWEQSHGEHLAHLTGVRWMDVPATRVRALTRAISGEGMPESDRARDELAGLIDAAVDGLQAHRETLDFGAIEADRAGSPDRSGFDPSKEATLARRYEAAAERGVYKALGEFRRVEAEAAEVKVARVEAPGPSPVEEPLGSFGAGAIGVAPGVRPGSSLIPEGRTDQDPPIVPGAERPRSSGPAGRGPG